VGCCNGVAGVPVEQSDIRALDYVVDSALKKIFDTNSKEFILECRLTFDLNSIGDFLLKRQRNFLHTSIGAWTIM